MSLRKERLSWIFIGALLAAVVVTAYFVLLPQLQPHLTVRLGDGIFNARVITPKDYAKNGMQHVNQLRADKAILHIYDSDGLWSIEMKDRHDSFDLVWLDSTKKVIHIVKNASAESVPATLFSPRINARYMIEMRGGSVDAKSIHIDHEAYFDENNIQGLKL
ncbi:MAG: hypothetical protein JWM07_117 [Candidatus Saccharibacteria bacterium]|nr:hypothetical protein [Candidatus Saccharibacteria bacterium]